MEKILALKAAGQCYPRVFNRRSALQRQRRDMLIAQREPEESKSPSGAHKAMTTMHHQSALFSRQATEEWLIYFRSSFSAFSLWVTGNANTFTAHGQYFSTATNIDLSLSVDGPFCSVETHLKPDEAALKRNRVLATAPLAGPLIVAGDPKGNCAVKNSYTAEDPMIEVESKAFGWKLEAYKARPDLVISPLLVFGIEGCEMVLEDYGMLNRERKRALPDTPLKRRFVGSCRGIKRTNNFESDIEGVALVVAIKKVFVDDFYMSVG